MAKFKPMTTSCANSSVSDPTFYWHLQGGSRLKGLSVAIDAIAQRMKTLLLIIGAGDALEQLKK